MDDIIEWLVDHCPGFALEDWYPLDKNKQDKFKSEFKEEILCRVYRHLDHSM